MRGATMSQCDQILTHMEKYRSITAMDALRLYQCMRLAARIRNLRDIGYNIHTNRRHLSNGKIVAEYILLKRVKK